MPIGKAVKRLIAYQEEDAVKLSNIRDIVAVAESGSLRAASRKLGITQPTMTRSIRDLEAELGLELFKRHAHGVVPTEIGEAFVRRAIAIQSEIRRILEEVDHAKGRLTGQVSVALSAAASIALMPVVLVKFQQKFPHALLKLAESLFRPIEADILSGEIDFFVGPLSPETSTATLLVEKLFDNRRIIVVRAGHPLRDARSLADLRGVRWVRPSFYDGRDESDFEAMFERAGLPPPEIVVHSRSGMMTMLAVANTDLLTILPVQWLDLVMANERVTTIDLDGALQAAPVCIVRRRDLPLTPVAEGLCDLVRKAGLNYQLRLTAPP